MADQATRQSHLNCQVEDAALRQNMNDWLLMNMFTSLTWSSNLRQLRLMPADPLIENLWKLSRADAEWLIDRIVEFNRGQRLKRLGIDLTTEQTPLPGGSEACAIGHLPDHEQCLRRGGLRCAHVHHVERFFRRREQGRVEKQACWN